MAAANASLACGNALRSHRGARRRAARPKSPPAARCRLRGGEHLEVIAARFVCVERHAVRTQATAPLEGRAPRRVDPPRIVARARQAAAPPSAGAQRASIGGEKSSGARGSVGDFFRLGQLPHSRLTSRRLHFAPARSAALSMHFRGPANDLRGRPRACAAHGAALPPPRARAQRSARSPANAPTGRVPRCPTRR
jgi:hypothetical protein